MSKNEDSEHVEEEQEDSSSSKKVEFVRDIPIELIFPDPNQPRKSFDEEKLEELAESIKKHGLLQPISVRPIENGTYQIKYGERRYRACQKLGLPRVRCIVSIEDSGNEAKDLEIKLVENIQRDDLNPIEEAETYQKLIKEFGYTHEQLASQIGKSRTYVTNKLGLLKASDEVKDSIRKKIITEGHARAILSSPSDERHKLLERTIEKQLTVRQTEENARILKNVTHVTSDVVVGDEVELSELSTPWLFQDEDGNIRDSVSRGELVEALVNDLKLLRRNS